MKVLFSAVLCIALMIYAAQAFSESDEICGTWINTKYVSGERPQKLILSYDGGFVTDGTIPSIEAIQRGVFQIIKKWKDSEENVWYQIKMHDPKKKTKYNFPG